jgi:hypothetical protein
MRRSLPSGTDVDRRWSIYERRSLDLYWPGQPGAIVLRFPTGGSALELEAIVPSTVPGQGIALDPSDQSILYAIDRRKHEIIVGKLQGFESSR